MEDEVVLKTPLNLTTNRLCETHQAPLRLHQNSYKNSYGERIRRDAIPGIRWRTTQQTIPEELRHPEVGS